MPDSTGTQSRRFAVTIGAHIDATVSYATYQNHVPLVRHLSISNETGDVVRDIEVILQCDPAFAQPSTLRFERLDVAETRQIGAVDLKFEHRYLAELNEAERGRVSVTVKANGAEIARKDHAVDVLAYDQWAGTRALPELLAAFSLPNNPVIDRLLHQAGELLAKAGKGQTVNGYQSKNREDAWAQISAIYSVIGAFGLHYIEPAASFGNDGQKIRTPERVLAGGVVTCLDLAMLVASCLEQAGLNPVVLLKKGHAWIGCWLVNTTFPSAIFDDGQAVRKRIAAGELLAFETTLLTHRPVASLRLACETGAAHLQDEAAFLFAVDIKRARLEQIRPLPFRGQPAQEETSAAAADTAPAIEAPPALPPLSGETFVLDEDQAPIETAEGRLARWKSRLLDLTLRNRLINFKPTKVMLPLRVPDPGLVEDALSDGQEWKFRPLPPLMEGDDPRVAAVALRRTGEDPIAAAAAQAMQVHELLAPVDPKKLDAQLYEIHSAAKLGLEEGGANTLYLALGFLRWAEDERAEKTLLAPILLVPVTLSRQSVRTGYAIKRHDDETIVNPTLVQLLRERFQLSIKGLDPLPVDGSGIDVARVWQIFRLAVKDIARWEVLEDVYLGIFSFTKYLMWKDLQDRSEQLKKNRVVNHLIENPQEPIGGSEDIARRDDIDDRHAPDSLLTPLLADSSQLNAISRAGAGHDFALEGPPGTGKSQTITNLIAHFLGQGKTVLFVSEKMAALDVVQRRLDSIGLGPFCLQLHSAKAKKTEVLAQLRTALEVSDQFTAEEWQREAERLQRLRAELNSLVKALHRVHPNGLTVRGATDSAIRFRQWTPAPMPWTDPDVHDRAALERLRENMRAIRSVAGELGRVKDHPLQDVRHSEWSNAWEDAFMSAVADLDAATVGLAEAAASAAPHLGLRLEAASAGMFDAIERMVQPLLAATQVPRGMATHFDDGKIRAAVRALREHGERRRQYAATLAKFGCKPDIARLDGDALSQAWSMASLAWWPLRWFRQRGVTGRLAAYMQNGQRPAVADVPGMLDCLRGLNAEDRVMKELGGKGEEWLGDAYRGADTDWSAVQRYEQWSAAMDEARMRLSGCVDEQTACAVAAQLRRLVGEQRASLGSQGEVARKLAAFGNAWQACRTGLQDVSRLAGADADLGLERHAPGLASRIRHSLSQWTSARRSIRAWCKWRQLRAQALENGMDGVISAFEDGGIAIADVVDFAEYTYQVWWLKAMTDREPVLRNFSSADHDRKIREFRDCDERFQDLTRRYVTAVLAGKVPRTQAGQKADPEMALLLREIAKQRAHLPVRKLVHGIPNLLPKLKPCLLMSPLSVAQYLDPAHSSFDVVVFDEASQILVWDAVGAIARGKQLVVVGDPKQLPPTSFFARADDEGEGGTDGEEGGPIQDLESILDECLGAGLPTLRLEWHYRSRHESLITFSNHRYYDSRLMTFPSPVTEDIAVRLEHVQGTYDRGATRTNRAEADAVVRAIVDHFSDDRRRKLTMGVVTFNQTQQRLIETLLDEELRKSPELEPRIAEHGAERLFIKNLENVQGDERDLILFSIAYGRDAAGRMPMNFGPLNKEGGQRRLNVAITRARVGITIYSSITCDDIDLARTRATGVIDLKNYLEFAQKGARALVEQSLPTGREPDSPFEMEVIRALRNKGWTVHPQVGCSGYRVDIGVVHPAKPGAYLLGVECDGATYHSLPSARDRDRLRQLVLEGLGWKLHRIWSTDWWTDSEKELSKMEFALRSALEQQEVIPCTCLT